MRRPASITVLLLLLTLVGCGGDDEEQSACTAAWAEAAEVDPLSDTPEDYRDTFVECATVDEWTEANVDAGELIPTQAEVIDNYCRTLGVSSTMCEEASSKLEPAGPPTETGADVDQVACDEFHDLPDAGSRMAITDAVLRRLSGKQDFSFNLSLDFAAEVEGNCATSPGSGEGRPGVKVADVATETFTNDRRRFGG